MNDAEKELEEARSLLEKIKNDFILLRYYPYLDEDRSEARALEKRIIDFLERPDSAREPT